jgi:hypothetical protein
MARIKKGSCAAAPCINFSVLSSHCHYGDVRIQTKYFADEFEKRTAKKGGAAWGKLKW